MQLPEQMPLAAQKTNAGSLMQQTRMHGTTTMLGCINWGLVYAQ
jgi:hypothetical protein